MEATETTIYVHNHIRLIDHFITNALSHSTKQVLHKENDPVALHVSLVKVKELFNELKANIQCPT